MKITVLCENTSRRANIEAEHGLSLYIETEHANILFDMGQTDLFCRNANILGVDLSRVDFAVLSHGHYDHGGGFEAFRQSNPNAPVFVSPHAFGQFYSTKFIGLSPSVAADPHVRPATGTITLAKGVTLWADCQIEADEMVGKGLFSMENGTLSPDDFRHEIYLLVQEKDKTTLFCGCSHRGVANIQAFFKPDVLVGGFHLKNLSPGEHKNYFDTLAHRLVAENTHYYTCHCTGEAAFSALQESMGDRLNALSCGDTLIL